MSVSKITGISKNNIARLGWIDYAKGIAIILVVYRHILIGVERSGLEVSSWLINANEIVYSFRMPLFFMISGLFVSKSIAKRNTFKAFFGYKINTIYYPYLIWGIIQISIQILLSKFTNAERGLIDFGLLLVHPRAIDQLWYLYALFNVSILFFFLNTTLKINDKLLFFISLIALGCSTFVKEYSLIHDTLYFLIFFVIGHLLRSFVLDESKSELFQSFIPFLILFPFFWGTQYYWLTHQDMNIYFFALIAVLGTLFVFSLSFILNKYQILSFLKIVGRHSLQVYLMHLIIVSAVRIIMVKFLSIDSPIAILLTGWVLGVYIPILAYQLLIPYGFGYFFKFKK
ncbi:acyltransferase family protein [Reichenbachiella ulvae]|uniref:Acyltransferase n=1 Tax=Reichenbachiella ulvae TaxID=2980104 RepID=A0ABT3D0I6_9BACT|nr:acyltransferase [Reichenbachiella ulvae]MCV9389472.1 acyltransferase [Reichenbachiella ulvae]